MQAYSSRLQTLVVGTRRSSNEFCSRSITDVDYDAAGAAAAADYGDVRSIIFHVCRLQSREFASVVSASAALISFQCIAPSQTPALQSTSRRHNLSTATHQHGKHRIGTCRTMTVMLAVLCMMLQAAFRRFPLVSSLLRDAMLARYMLSSCVRPSVTSRHCNKTAKLVRFTM